MSTRSLLHFFAFSIPTRIPVLSVLGVTSFALKDLLYAVGKAVIKTFDILLTDFFPHLLYLFPQLVKRLWAIFKLIQTLFYDCPEVFYRVEIG